MSGRFRPRRRLRSELASLAVSASVPLALLLSFPGGALRPLPVSAAGDSEPACAFVVLAPGEEQKALAAARAAWQLDRSSLHFAGIDFFAEDLPPLSQRAVLGLSALPRVGRDVPATHAPDLLPPTLAAPAPVRIAPQPDADVVAPAFSREELLQLN